MRRFLRTKRDDESVVYLNFDRIERIEIDKSLTTARIFLIDNKEPLIVRGDAYSALIEHLGADQEAE